MWAFSRRGSNWGDHRTKRDMQVGLVRVHLRGPAEHTIVELEGELDFTCARELARRVLELPRNVVSVGLGELEFIDAEGVLALKDLLARLAERSEGPAPQLTDVRDPVKRTFALVERREMACSVD